MTAFTGSIESLAQRYISLDKNEVNRAAIQKLLDAKDTAAMEKVLRNPIEFGTAGLRANMGPGFSQMNDLTVIQASQGLSAYVEREVADAKKRGVVIGHDHRHHSERFARLAVATFLTAGFKVYFYPNLCHTPSVPYAVKALKAACGVMVTASHNPKDDNGYKVYWENGAQIIPPHDSGIAKSISEHFEPKVWDEYMFENSPNCVDLTLTMFESYFKDATKLLETPELNEATDLKYVYTAMHGVGMSFAQKMLQTMHLHPAIAAPEQTAPNPDFPTVSYPNPEELGALDLAKKTADEQGASLVIANDPDADRFTAEEKQADGKWHRFTGDQLGSIFGAALLERSKRDNIPINTLAIVNSTVSSRMLEVMAKQAGASYGETLTGFKWMANRLVDFEKEGKKILFGYEEAIGYLVSDSVLDKDGVTALGFFTQLAAQLHEQGMNVYQYLISLYKKYGYFASNNKYFRCSDPAKTTAIFNRMRFGPEDPKEKDTLERFDIHHSNGSVLRYPTHLGVEPIIGIRDLTFGFECHNMDGANKRSFSVAASECAPSLPCSSSQMITFYMPSGRMTLRSSGTEPKVKHYIEMHGKFEEKEKVHAILDSVYNSMRDDLMRAKENNLQ